MGQFSAINRLLDWIETAAIAVWQILKYLWYQLRNVSLRIWGWLKVRVPFIEALTRRHLNNPATFFVDIATFILALYLAFGVTGYILVYKVKSSTRFTETLTVLYPLPAVEVNNSFIWSHHFLQRLRFLNTFNEQGAKTSATKPPTGTQLRAQIMQQLIEDQVIYLEAKKHGVAVSEKELNDAYALQKKQTPDLESKVKQLYGMTPDEFKQVLAQQLLKAKVKSVVITQVRVSHILVTTPQAAQAAEQQLASGRPFADVAKDFSQDAQTKDKGGDLGYWTKGELAAQIGQNFEDAAFNIAINKPSDPIQTKFGYHIVLTTEKTGNNYQTYDEWYTGVKKDYKIHQFIPI